MKAPQDFQYSPNGYRVKRVAEGDEMTQADQDAAAELGIIKAKKAPANKARGNAPLNKAAQ